MSGRERIGLVVIRVWFADSEALRARITLVHDLEEHESESVVVADPEAIVAAVRSFLDDFSGAVTLT